MTPRLLLLGLLVLPSAPPDRRSPFVDRRVVAERGDQYVVIRKAGSGITFELCRRRAGAPRMQPARKPWNAKDDGAIARDPEDVLVAEGKVAQLPLDIVVLDELPGFVLFEQYHRVGRGQTVTYVDGKGQVVMSLTLEDLYDRVPRGGMYSPGWFRDFFVDEERQSVVVVSRRNEAREVGLTAMEIGAPDLGERLTRILDSGWTTHDGRIARYFLGHPSKSAVPALEEALARWPRGSREHERFRDALAVCRKYPY